MSRRETLFAGAALIALFLTVVLVRPVLPVDETRYLSVAWEMFLRQDWLAPLTVNFEPYHHKPPLLFWLINTAWAAFGVSRWAATVPVMVAAGAVVYLTARLCQKLVPAGRDRIVYVLIGSLPFVVYGTLIMFDMTVTVFVLAALLCLLSYAESGRRITLAWLGLIMGLGVLTKGPVMYLYVLFPVLLGPYWYRGEMSRSRWYLGNLAAFALSFLPVLVWLIPLLAQTSDEFAYALLWEQTAARIAGSQDMAHPRPAWFYLPFVVLFCIPWLFYAAFWRRLAVLRLEFFRQNGLRFVALWLLPTLVAFSLIGGKQPHYLVPLLPGLAIIQSWLLVNLRATALRKVATAVVVGAIALHLALSESAFSRYELAPVAEYVAQNPDRDLAFPRRYRGEITFLARLATPVDVPAKADLPEWFDAHPDGLAVITYTGQDDLSSFNLLYTMPYRGKQIGIFSRTANLLSVN